MKKQFWVFIAILLLSSCTIKPEKITNYEKYSSTKDIQDKLHVVEDNKEHAINLRQAIALAIENNLEYRLKKIQSALSYKQYDLAKAELYPRIDISYSYDRRSTDYIKALGTTTGDPSTSQSLVPHTVKRGNIVFNWDVLDFGLSYVRAKQAADRYLMSLEQRKQMAATLINDVVKNYTLAYYGQELESQLNDMEGVINEAMKNTDQAIKNDSGDLKQMLNYKKSLMQDFRQAKDYLTYFNQSRDKLLNLINYNSSANLVNVGLKLEAPDPYLVKLPAVTSNLKFLDTIALYYRPELSESMYKIREFEKQKTIAVLEKLPSFGFNLGYNYESDKYLVYQNWWSDNMSIAWNLLSLANIPAAIDTVETQIESSKLTLLASSAVVLGEVRILLYNYKMKKYDFHLAEKESKFADDIYSHTLFMATSDLGHEQDLVRDKLSAMNSELSKLRTFVDARNIFEDLVKAMGLYNFGGELINRGYVDIAFINKWLDRFIETDFDVILQEESKRLDAIGELAINSEEGSDADKSELVEPKKEEKKPSLDEHSGSTRPAEIKPTA